MDETSVFTIGFTKTSAEKFFSRLLRSGASRIIDVRLNNQSQLAGFAKAKDLPFFLKQICQMDYVHNPMLAPTEDMLRAYKNEKGSWDEYTKRFLGLMEFRRIESELDPSYFSNSCLLCSEDKPHHCHRRLVCDYLNQHWGHSLRVHHL